MSRAELLAIVAGEIVARKRVDRPLKIGIDGRCAAGKTMFADELGRILSAKGYSVLRPSVDGFHHPSERRYRQGEYSARGYYEDAYNYDAVVNELLEPLSGPAFPVRCRQVSFDWRTDLPLDEPAISVDANAILLFEGIFVFRRAIHPYWDYRILMDVDAQTSLSRALVRDGTGPAEIIRRKYEQRYEPAWQIYENEEHPAMKADLVIDNRDVQSPEIRLRT